MPSPSITGSVADLFATLGLDVGPLSASLAESKAMIKEAGADMSLSLGALQSRYQQVITSLTQGTEATTAYQAALQSLGVSTGNATQLTAAQVSALAAEKSALEQLIRAEQAALDVKIRAHQEVQGEIQAAAIEQEIANKKIAQLNQIAVGEARAAALNKQFADERVAAANLVAEGEARALAMEAEIADARIALANQIAIGTARAEAMQTEAQAAAVAERIKLANQYAEAEVRAAAIVKEAQAADSIPVRMGLRAGTSGLNPTIGTGASGLIAGAAAAFVGYEAVKQFAEFDDAINKSLSIMKDVTEFQKTQMIKTAKDLSVAYGISSVEIAHAFYTLESAGRTTEEALKDMPAVVQFAFTASADGIMKVSTAAETLTSVFNALKGSGGSIEHISDLLLKADTIAQGTGEQFAKALAGKGAGAIQILGKSAEEGLAILATMAKAGIPAAQQQTALIQILRDLPREAEKYQDVLITLNGHQMKYKELLYDSTGTMKDFSVILGELETLFNGASTETIQHDLALLHLNSRTNQSIQALLGMSSTLKDYETQLKNAAGTTQKVADIRMDSAKTEFNKLGEAARLAAIDMGTVLAPAAKASAGVIADTIVTVHDLSQGYIALAEAAYKYFTGQRTPPAPPKPPPAPAMGFKGSGSVEDPDADSKRKAAAERAAQERNRIQEIRLESAKKAEEALVQMEIESIKHEENLHKISAEDAEAQLLAQNEKLLKIQENYELKKLALETTKKSSVYEATVEAQMSAANSRRAAADQKATFDRENREAKSLKEQQKIYDEYQKNLTAGLADFDKEEAKRNQEITDDKLKAIQIEEAGEAKHQTNLIELERQKIAYQESIGAISASQRLKLEQDLDDQIADIQEKAVQRELNILIKKGGNDNQYYSKKEALENQLADLADRRAARSLKTQIQILHGGEEEIRQLQNKIQFEREYGGGIVSVTDRIIRRMQAQMELDTLMGKSNSAQMIALEMLKVKEQALIDKQHELGIVFKETEKNVSKLWNEFGDKVGEAILAGGKFWAFWRGIMHDFEVEMLKTVIHGVLKTLKDEILSLPGVASTLGKVFSLGGVGTSAATAAAGAGQQAASITQASTVAANAAATAAKSTADVAGTAAKAVSTSITSIVGMVSGVVSAISGVIGNFQMAGMNKTLDLIENYTRYLKIGLVEQGDSLLNDSHVIRNTLTDFMAWNWGVATNYYQQICEKLDALIGHGGMPGITLQSQLAVAGGGPADVVTDAGLSLGTDASVNVDLRGSTFNGEVTDTQVDAIFNRGIDRAKRSGAFRPGTWPR